MSVGIGSFAATDGDAPGALGPLEFAADHSLELGKAVSSLGYQESGLAADVTTAKALGDRVESEISAAGPDDLLVLHILSHGQLGETGTLYVVGPDGKTHPLTNVEYWLKRVEDFPGRPSTLFLLDLCHSGSAARLPWQFSLADGSNRAWVIAASQPDRQAFDGRFTKAVATVLTRVRRGELDIDRSVRYVPLGTVAREIRREVDALATASGGFPQQVTCTAIDVSAQVDVPFFPNPGYREDARNQVRGRIDTALAPFLDDLDEIFDAGHFISRAAGHGPMADRIGTGCFSGRKDELTELTDWMNQDEDGPIRLVTGSAGVGKSALIGVLVCAAHPELRAPTKVLWREADRVPGKVAHMAAAHARQRSLSQVTQSLASQLGFGECPVAEDLIAKVRQSPTCPLLVLDALDEALEPAVVMDQLLLPLAAAVDDNGEPACRLLVGVRDEPRFAPLREAAAAGNGLIDLNAVPDSRLGKDLYEYISKLLRSQEPYDQPKYAGAQATFAASVAESLVARRAGNRWGEFLVAALYTHHLLTAYEPIADHGSADRLGRQVPSELPEVLELDLRSRQGAPLLRPVLAVLAHALGEGMPATLIRAVAPLFAASETARADEVSAALDAARFYLRHTVDTDGTTIYRLFHQGLADYLRQHPMAPGTPAPPNMALRLLNGLLAALPASIEDNTRRRQWSFAEPYLARHALAHAQAADRPEVVIRDLEFLVHADPAIVGRMTAPVTAIDDYDDPVYVYLGALTRSGLAGSPRQRRQILADTAARLGAPELARQWANPPGEAPLSWQRTWMLHGGLDPITDAAVARLPGGSVIAAITRSGTVIFLDLATGKVMHERPGSYLGYWIREVSIGGYSTVLLGTGDERFIYHDPGADPVPVKAHGLLDEVALAALQHPLMSARGITVSASTALISLAADGFRLVYIDNASRLLSVLDTGGDQVFPLTSERIDVRTTALANVTVDGQPFLAAGTTRGEVGLWDVATLTLRDVIYLDDPVEHVIPAGPDQLAVLAGGTLYAIKRGGT